MSAEQIAALERPLATQMLEQAADRNALAAHWDALPKALRSEPEIVAAYARRAIALDWPEPAARALEQVLDSHWTPDLLPLHAQASTTTEPAEQADQLQRWLASHPDDPALLLRAGQLAMRRQQWQLARDHLLRARDAGAAEAAWEALGESHARQGQDALASTCLLNAVRLRRGEAVQPLEDEPAAWPSSAMPTACPTWATARYPEPGQQVRKRRLQGRLFRCSSQGNQRSMIATTPMPPAVQIDTSARPPPRWASCLAAAATTRPPVAANG